MLAAAVLAVSSMAAEAATVDILRGKVNFLAGKTKILLATEGLQVRATGAAKTRAVRRGTLVKFGMTGTSKDGKVIKHAGSGLSLSDGDRMISLGNFRIDMAKRSVFADVVGGEQNVQVMKIKKIRRNGRLKLVATDEVGRFFEDQGPDQTPTDSPASEVPLPAAGFLLIGALGGLALVKRRKSGNV